MSPCRHLSSDRRFATSRNDNTVAPSSDDGDNQPESQALADDSSWTTESTETTDATETNDDDGSE